VLGLVWDHIARLQTGTLATWATTVAMLASLARDSSHFAKYIIEEDDVGLLVRLLKDGVDVTLRLLAHNEESVEKLLSFGVYSVVATALKEPLLCVQATAAEAGAHGGA
jgi:hypothetical protein